MKSSAKKVELASVDDLFSTEESRLEERLEKIQEIPLSELHPVSYTHLRAHETKANLVCRLLLEKKKKKTYTDVKHRL